MVWAAPLQATKGFQQKGRVEMAVLNGASNKSSRKWLIRFVVAVALLAAGAVVYKYTSGGTTKTEVPTTTEEFNQLLANRAADDKKLNESFQSLTNELKIAKEEAAAAEEQVEALKQAIHVLTPKKSK